MEIKDMNCLAVLQREIWYDYALKEIIILFFSSPHTLPPLKVQYSCVTPAPGIWDISMVIVPTDYENWWN